MSKFVIECPVCGRYAEASTGFFARKKIDCSCGNVIDVKVDKLTSRVCPHCGNSVVFDQSKGADAKCPVCHEPINTTAQQEKTVEFSCAQCGVRLHTAKGADSYVCPVCDHVNDVPERVKNEQLKRDGLASIIKYEGNNDAIVWKHPIEDFNMGSQLIVHESQEAVFFRDGQALDLFSAGRYTLETQQLPVLEKLYKLPTDTEGTFHSEVYYINMATHMGIKWGTDSKIRLFDPMTGMHVELGASGEFNIRVVNSRKLLVKLVGTTGGMTIDHLVGTNGKSFFRSMVMTQVKSYLAATIRENSINVLEIDAQLLELSNALMARINPKLAEYGLEITEFFVSRVVTPDDDPDFQRMKKQFGERHLLQQEDKLRQIKAQSDVNVKLIGAQGEADALKIQKTAEIEMYRLQAEAEAMEMRMKGFTYQQETARQVGLEAMQNGLGASGSGNNGGGIGGTLGDVAGLGIALGAMGGVVNMTKDVLNPVMESTAQMGKNVGGAVEAAADATGWECACGTKNIQSKFCPNCGNKKPEPAQGWDCAECGTKGITSKFCPNCGAKKPEEPKGWDCSCGAKNIMSKFCPECGAKKPEADLGWECPECGQKEIKTKFCPNCGHKKDE